MNKTSPLIEKLADLVGFHKNYTNSFGSYQTPKDEALESLLSAMGYDLACDARLTEQIKALEEKQWRSIIPSTHIVKSNKEDPFISISLKKNNPTNPYQTVNIKITTEQKKSLNQTLEISTLSLLETVTLSGSMFSKYQLQLPKLHEGYHQLSIVYGNQTDKCHLIVVPEKCVSVEETHINKMWGYTAQLYSLRSSNNFGMGDFNDLNSLIINAAKQGASIIGLNPLHPLYQNNPTHISPYSPISRCFINTLYIDVKSVPNFSTCTQANKLFNSTAFQAKLAQTKSSDLIDYPVVAELKQTLLGILFEDFFSSTTLTNTPYKEAFNKYKKEQNQDLLTLATFEALYEHFNGLTSSDYTWKTWPVAYQTPTTNEVKIFQKSHAKRIEYFMYLQWLAHEQLTYAVDLTTTSNMPIGLYLDLAVGCDDAGVDVWSNQDVYVSGTSIGAPPDAMNTLGQNWGLTPMNPVALKEQGYLPLVKALRSNMQYAGALRIDHILGLMRQYWVAPGMEAHEGVYITFPLEDILSIIALESHRAKCIVIGEDLGTVPEGFSEVMAKSGILSYKVLYFERWWESGLFKRPEVYPSQAIVTTSTHDLPTLRGWWSGRDLTWKQELNLYPDDEMKNNEQSSRIKDRHFLIATLKDVGLVSPEDINEETLEITSTKLNMAIQAYIAKTPSHIQLIPLEDALELVEQVNIPGTIDQHPNWCQKLPTTIDNLWKTRSVRNITNLMNKIRPR